MPSPLRSKLTYKLLLGRSQSAPSERSARLAHDGRFWPAIFARYWRYSGQISILGVGSLSAF